MRNATVGLRIDPAPPGSGADFRLEVELGSMPYAFFKAVEDTVLATLAHWTLDPQDRPQALVPVPLHPARLRQRGYDQALELARRLARLGGLPVRADALRRVRATAAQTRLDAAARQRNLQAAFAVRAGVTLPAHVALVDDVMTTGATLHACARVLLAAGVRRVDAWCIARA